MAWLPGSSISVTAQLLKRAPYRECYFGKRLKSYIWSSFLFLSTYFVCACVCICVWSRDSLWELVPSIHHEGYGVELGLSDSAASAFTCHAILPWNTASAEYVLLLVCQLILSRPLYVGDLKDFLVFGRKRFEEFMIVVWYLTNWSRLLHQMVHVT